MQKDGKKGQHNELSLGSEKENREGWEYRAYTTGFKDKNVYELKQTCAPITRSPLVRMMLVVAIKLNLKVVNTAFLNGTINERFRACKLAIALHGLHISRKKKNCMRDSRSRVENLTLV